jgi:hypothetical protein
VPPLGSVTKFFFGIHRFFDFKMGLETPIEIEKSSQIHHEHAEHSSANSLEDPILNEFTPAETAAIIRRIDRRLIITVGLMYCISLMDRTNLGAAAIAGSVELTLCL